MRSAVMLAALALLGARAEAQNPAEPSGPRGFAGRYVADFSDAPPSLGWTSAIELKPDGTFLWNFATRELDLSARGRWCRDGPDRLDLTNEEAVGSPEVQLAQSSRDGGEGVLVSLEPDSREATSHLGVEAEYPDGYHERFRFRDFQVRLPSSPQRPLVAVRLVSDAFTYRSWPIEVTRDGDNVLGLRVVPANFAQAAFGSQAGDVRDGRLTIHWWGYAIPYDRAPPAADDNGADVACLDAFAPADVPGEALSEPWVLSGDEPAVGALLVRLDEPLDATRRGSTLVLGEEEGGASAAGVAELRLITAGQAYDFGRVSALSWHLAGAGDGLQVASLAFSPQDRMLSLGETLLRARMLQQWLARASFAPAGSREEGTASFQPIDPARFDEEASDWTEAESWLSADEPGLAAMHLFTMSDGAWTVEVRVEDAGRTSAMATTPGREWVVRVLMFRAGMADGAGGAVIGSALGHRWRPWRQEGAA
ncbi:hypothetical protein [Sphingosinicella terrae]|uniref:hypothetical protein n=1 Tax=Sphingosinicella terrae TaxID=2172047 RepID=UPI000E0D68E3|nr:hypothetical protein [Sphingosinicella terrae]